VHRRTLLIRRLHP